MFYAFDTIGDLVFATSSPSKGQDEIRSVRDAFHDLANYIRNHCAELIQERIYGSVSASKTILSIREAVYNELGIHAPVPPTYVEGQPAGAHRLAGIHAVLARPRSGASFSWVQHENQVCGGLYQGDDAQYLSIADAGRMIRYGGGFQPGEETYQTLRTADLILNRMKWSFHDVYRTWFYLDDILNWYSEFNLARSQMFHEIGLIDKRPDSIIPASTGIRGRNARGNACTLDLLAMRPRNGHPFNVSRLLNPRQNEAPEYGSAFSRGLEVSLRHCRYLFISGTASIDETGATVHLDDSEAQIKQTLLSVRDLIHDAGATISHICQATVFLKHAKDLHTFRRIAPTYGLREDVCVRTIADVCRSDLLFELDATAVLPAS